MFFSMITKNLDWKTLTKNSVTFKRWDGLKDGLILWGFADFFFFLGGGVTKIQKYWADYLNGGRLGQFADLRGTWQKRGGGAFEGV